MNIQHYIDNPEQIEQLTQPQKLQLFQDLSKHQHTIQQEKIKLQTELDIKTKEQQELFTQLQEATGETTLAGITSHINSKQSEFDTQLTKLSTQFQELQ